MHDHRDLQCIDGVHRSSCVVIHGRGTTRAEDARGTPAQSHTSPSILVYEDDHVSMFSKQVGMSGNDAGSKQVGVIVRPSYYT